MNSTSGNTIIRFDTTRKFELDWKIHDFLPLLKTTSNITSPYFTWRNIMWQLNMVTTSEKGIQLDLHKITRRKQLEIYFKFGFRFSDGRSDTRIFTMSNFNDVDYKFGTTEFILKKQLLKQKHQLMPQGILTVSCLLANTDVTFNFDQEDGRHGWASDLRRMFGCTDFSDITFVVGEERYPAHICMLGARSDVFAAMFKHDMEEVKTGIVNVTDCDPTIFKYFLLFLYTGMVTNFSCDNVLDYYRIADKYNVQSLKDSCIEFIKEQMSEINFLDFVLANQFDDSEIRSAVQEVFNKHANKIIKRDDWEEYVKQNYSEANQFLINFTEIAKIEDEE